MMATDKDQSRELAQTLVEAVLSVSPRLDTFSTWLMGITTGALVLIISNIDKTIAIFKVGSTKMLIAFLAVSALLGLLQKYNALQLQIQMEMKEAAVQKVRELATAHAGERVANPSEYWDKHTDPSKVPVLFASAFAGWMRKKIFEIMVCESPADLRDLQSQTKRLLWQSQFIAAQVLCSLATILIILFSF